MLDWLANKKILIVVAMFCFLGAEKISAITTENGKSFFSPQPLQQILAPINDQFSFYSKTACEQHEKFRFGVAPFLVESAKANSIRKYLFPDGKESLVLSGSESDATPDISATWLKIAAPMPGFEETELLDNAFESEITINPKYKFFGLNLNFAKNYGRFWIECSVPVTQAQFDLGLQEKIMGAAFDSMNQVRKFDMPVAPGLPPKLGLALPGWAAGNDLVLYPAQDFSGTARQALDSPERNFSRLSSQVLKKNGFGDIRLRIGTGIGCADIFFQAVVPFSERPTNKYLFEPIVGNRGHWEFGVGGDGRFETELRNNIFAQVHLGGDCSVMLPNMQTRTFDFANYGSLSRFFLVRKVVDYGAGSVPSYAAEPAVNIFTKNVTVGPRAAVNGMCALGFEYNKLFFRGGYGMHFISQEYLRLPAESDAVYGIASMGDYTDRANDDRFAVNPTLAGHMNSQAAAFRAGNPPNPVLKNNHLDLHSATQPQIFRSDLNLQAGFNTQWHGLPITSGLVAGCTVRHGGWGLEHWFIGLYLNLSV